MCDVVIIYYCYVFGKSFLAFSVDSAYNFALLVNDTTNKKGDCFMKKQEIFIVRANDGTDIGYALSNEEADILGKANGGRYHIAMYPLNTSLDKNLKVDLVAAEEDGDKVYVVRTADNTDFGYALSFEMAKEIGKTHDGRFHIDFYLLNRIIDQRHRHTAFSTNQIICGREIPAFQFI